MSADRQLLEVLKNLVEHCEMLRDPAREVREALAHLSEPQAAAQPVAWIQHHKAGDNLVWDDPGGYRTPLYAPDISKAAEPTGDKP